MSSRSFGAWPAEEIGALAHRHIRKSPDRESALPFRDFEVGNFPHLASDVGHNRAMHDPKGTPQAGQAADADRTAAYRPLNRGREVFDRWRRRLGLEPLDVWFAALRVATLGAGMVWWALATDAASAPSAAVLTAFLAFTVALYTVNVAWPGHLARLYHIALVFDLGIVFVLVRLTGGFASDLHLAFILLIALHAFYSGLRTGLATAGSAIALYALAGPWPPPIPGFLLRTAFFALVGLSMGIVSEQARRRREALEEHQEHLMRSDRLATIGELAAGLAHELRNPLAGVAGALHVLGGRLPPDDPSRDLLVDVQAQITRMNKTLTDLLQHARPAEPQRIAVDINALLEHSVQFLPRGNVRVIRDFDESLPPLLADPNLLHQAFLNILVNARQAMPDGGRLTMRTRRAGGNGGGIHVLIDDTGEGIRAEHAARIFQPFFTTKSQGTGLGLAIAARVVEQHGGRITVASAPGQGTTFTIALPVLSASLERTGR